MYWLQGPRCPRPAASHEPFPGRHRVEERHCHRIVMRSSLRIKIAFDLRQPTRPSIVHHTAMLWNRRQIPTRTQADRLRGCSPVATLTIRLFAAKCLWPVSPHIYGLRTHILPRSHAALISRAENHPRGIHPKRTQALSLASSASTRSRVVGVCTLYALNCVVSISSSCRLPDSTAFFQA
jgi:hypothetical protein